MTDEELKLAPQTIEKLKAQVALVLTDNETLTAENAKLHEDNANARKQAQEFAQLNDLLHQKSQRLEQDAVILGKQRDQFRDSFEKQQRLNESLIKRIEILKLVRQPEAPVKLA